MRQLTPEEIRFAIHRGLQQLDRSTIRDLSGPADKRRKGLDMATAVIAARFDRLEVFGPDIPEGTGDRPGQKLRAQGREM